MFKSSENAGSTTGRGPGSKKYGLSPSGALFMSTIRVKLYSAVVEFCCANADRQSKIITASAKNARSIECFFRGACVKDLVVVGAEWWVVQSKILFSILDLLCRSGVLGGGEHWRAPHLRSLLYVLCFTS